jgi:hypothetical protein
MLDELSKLAEKTAMSLSRRRFLIRLGLGAAAVTALVRPAFGSSTCVYHGGSICRGYCQGAYPYYNTITKTCCSDSKCQSCNAPCTYKGSCCGGSMPYYYEGTHRCYKDPQCLSCTGNCTPSECCGGTGACWQGGLGALCYTANDCNVPCA